MKFLPQTPKVFIELNILSSVSFLRLQTYIWFVRQSKEFDKGNYALVMINKSGASMEALHIFIIRLHRRISNILSQLCYIYLVPL